MSQDAPFDFTPAREQPVPTFGERFVGMLTRPREVFEGLTEPDAWFWPSMMLLAGHLIYLVGLSVGLEPFLRQQLNTSMQGAMGSSTPPGAVPPGLDTFLQIVPSMQLFVNISQAPAWVAWTWALRSTLFYFLATALGGRRIFWGRLVAMVGWAWIPILFQYVLIGTAMIFAPQLVGWLTPNAETADPQRAAQIMQQRWPAQVLLALSPFVLWNLWLCVLGIETIFKLPRGKAALVVLIPTLGQVALQLGSYFFSLWMMQSMGGMAPATPPPPTATPPAPAP